MKKRNLKSLHLSKKTISSFKLYTINGAGRRRSERLEGNCNYSRRNPGYIIDGSYCASGIFDMI